MSSSGGKFKRCTGEWRFHNQAADGASATLLGVTTPSAGPAPDAPTVTQDTAGTTYNQIALAWTPASTSTVAVAGYNVYRRAHGSSDPFVRLTSTPIAATGYVDQNVAQGSYDYQVRAVSALNSPSPAGGITAATAAPAADLPPTVALTGPAAFSGISVDFSKDTQSDGRIRTLTAVTGSIDDPNGDLASWKLFLHPVDAGSGAQLGDIPLTSGATPAGTGRNPDGTLKNPAGATLYTLDPTLYPSGDYNLVLSATDVAGHSSQTSVKVSLYSQTKLGNLTLPVTDLNVQVPGGGPPITLGRVYDSGTADTHGDFGYGWKMNLNDTSLSTTAGAGTGTRGSDTSFRPGDLVYVTLPGGEQHAFQFFPVPNNYTLSAGPVGADPYGGLGIYEGYYVQFVCVDGSNATLTVPGDIHEPNIDNRIDLQYDRLDNEFFASGTNGFGGQFGYNPSLSAFGNQYTVTTADGRGYSLNASTGKLKTSSDANGNTTTYDNAGNATTVNGLQLKLVRGGPGNAVTEAYLANAQGSQVGQPITYAYDSTGNLASVTGRDGKTTQYVYYTDPGRTHYLKQVINPLGVASLTAEYNDPLARLTKLTDAAGNALPLGNPASDGSSGSQVVVDPLGNTTQNVYDDHGNVARTIQSMADSNGNVTGYSVTVHSYGYFGGGLSSELTDIFDPSSGRKQPGVSSQNVLTSQTDYAPFVVSGTDTAGLRFSEQPAQALRQVSYGFTRKKKRLPCRNRTATINA